MPLTPAPNSFFKLLFFSFTFLFSFSIYSQELSVIFNKIKATNEKNYPPVFSCVIRSTIIDFQLKNIPADMIEFKKTPVLFVQAERTKKPKLELTGTLPFYKNYFLPYEDFIFRSGLFIGIDNYHTFSLLKKEFNIKVKNQEKFLEISLKEKEGLPGDYAKYFFKKENYQLTKAFYYENNVESANLTFFYKKIKNYLFPKRIIVRIDNSLNSTNEKSYDEYFVDFKNCGK